MPLFDDHPIVRDSPYYCLTCRGKTPHTITVYPAEETYRCKLCGGRLERTFHRSEETGRWVKDSETYIPGDDPRIKDSDFKRQNPRHYKPRGE